MNAPLSLIAAISSVLGLAAVASAASPASGRFQPQGESHAVVDAVAWRGQYGIDILLADRPLDTPELLSDSTLDTQDQYTLEGASLRLTVYTTDGSRFSLSLVDAKGIGGDPECAEGRFLDISRLDEGSIAGRFACGQQDVVFDLPVLAERPGSRLAEGGGEPGMALLAFAAAIKAQDLDAFIRHASPAEAEKAEESRQEGPEELAAMFRFRSYTMPSDMKIVGGIQTGDRAWLDFASPDNSVAGQVRLLRIDGRWLVDGGKLRP